MGEEAKQEGAAAAEQGPKPEDNTVEQKDEKPQEEKKEEAKPYPHISPPPVVLFVYLHCVGCAKKIRRSILKCRGVEEVETDIEKNEVTVKGVVDPQVLCSRIQKKTSRMATVLSPLPPPDAADTTNAEAKVAHDDSRMVTVELLVNMHCEACAQQLRKKILKMRGVQAADTDLTANKVTVTGTVSAHKLAECIYRRTGKMASVVPPPPQEEKNEDSQKKVDEEPPEKDEKPEEKKKDGDDGAPEATKEEKAAGVVEPKTEEVEPAKVGAEELVKRMMYWGDAARFATEDEMARRMAMMNWMPMTVPTRWMPMTVPTYVMDRQQLLPPFQIFSDENPNACCIT